MNAKAELLNYVESLSEQEAEDLLEFIATEPKRPNYGYQPSPAELRAIDAGLADIEAGRTVPYEQVRRETREWLNKLKNGE